MFLVPFFKSFFKYFYFIFNQRNNGSKHASLASVVTTGYPTNNPHSAVASNNAKAFKGTSFAGRKANVPRNAALEKEGKLFVQVLYPDHFFTAGVYFTTLYIKVVHYKGVKVVPAWY
jgi:hypothetical protein